MDVIRFRWNGSEFRDVTESPTIPLLVADSFRVHDGSAVGIHEHAQRFISNATEQGLIHSPKEFFYAALAHIPKKGQLFPRIDVTERGELELTIRPAPQLSETASVATAEHDPRSEPGIKGPDIPALNDLRAQAQAAGADEAIILSPKGEVIDGATSAIIWGKDERWFMPLHTLTRVASTTIQQMSHILGGPLNGAAASPDQLSGHEIYILNALHGIRAVTQWSSVPDLVLNHDRLESWRSAYTRLFEPLPGK